MSRIIAAAALCLAMLAAGCGATAKPTLEQRAATAPNANCADGEVPVEIRSPRSPYAFIAPGICGHSSHIAVELHRLLGGRYECHPHMSWLRCSLSSRAGAPKVYRLPSGSMEPSYTVGELVLASEGAPSVGAVVILHQPEGAEEELCGPSRHVVKPGGAACAQSIPREDVSTSLIKRIVAGPGDEIYIRAGHVYRKPAGQTRFARVQEPYIRACGSSNECNFPTPISIPAGEWFMLGDNRGESDDSRFWGPVPTRWIVGIVNGVELRCNYRYVPPTYHCPRAVE